MHAQTLGVIIVAMLSTLSAAAPAIEGRAPLTVLSQAQVTSLRPYTLFAGAGYCRPQQTADWTCGVFCDSLQGFAPTASGGNGAEEQFWFVGFHAPLNSVVVVHQGTNPFVLQALLTDVDILLVPLNATLFPETPAGVLVHEGFRNAHARSADAIRDAVLTTLAGHPGAAVAFVGHSLGAALSTLDAVSLRSLIPAATPFKFVGYGSPRVGNPAFANYVDSILADFTRVNNREDPIPIVPWEFAGFRHPSGEVHISLTSQWLVCPGQDSKAAGCIDQTAPNLLLTNVLDHLGPYDGIMLGLCNGVL
ncbi:lipase [Auricularia subglabra TFB-10046 SS5]|nr:lipase [Auricularia subglabra TFB-10046 SS5]